MCQVKISTLDANPSSSSCIHLLIPHLGKAKSTSDLKNIHTDLLTLKVMECFFTVIITLYK